MGVVAVQDEDGSLGTWTSLNSPGVTRQGHSLLVVKNSKLFHVGGMLMLALYYLAYPPLFGAGPAAAEGHYLIVNKNLVELFANSPFKGLNMEFERDRFQRRNDKGELHGDRRTP